MKPVLLRDEAIEDIVGAFTEFEAARPGIGQRFVKQVREILERLERMPEMYAVLWHDVRAVRVKKYRHVLYYVVLDDRVEVLGVIQGSRDAPAWQSRR